MEEVLKEEAVALVLQGRRVDLGLHHLQDQRHRHQTSVVIHQQVPEPRAEPLVIMLEEQASRIVPV